MKIVTVIGARPQFIKAAIVSKAVQNSKKIKEIIVHTGQHYDHNLSQIFLEELDIKINHQLKVNGTSHGTQTSQMLAQIENVLMQEQPDYVLVYGDTNSTLAATLAAAKLHVPIAHVEAGLRSYNRKMPEEINRVVTDHLSTILFTPTTQAVQNLIKEGFNTKQIISVGDVMYDAAIYYGQKAKLKSQILKELNLAPQNYILTTIHRAENTDDLSRLNTIFLALERIGSIKPVILPLHPRTRKELLNHLPQIFNNERLKIIDPVGFMDMLQLEVNAALIMTDSGGIQKEAFFHRIPCLTLRDETEWVETVDLGWNYLVKPFTADNIYQAAIHCLKFTGIKHDYPYGKGNAAELIVKHLEVQH